MKVLHIIPSVAACRGGPSKAIIEMVNALNTSGISAEIATTNDDCDGQLNVALGSLITFQNAPVRFFERCSPAHTALKEFQYSRSFSRWLRHHIAEYDVLHIHAIFSFTSSYAMWLARKRGVPYIVRPIGQLEHWALQQSGLKKRLYLALLERRNLSGASATHFTANSEYQQALDVMPIPQPHIIPLGVHPSPEVAAASMKLHQRYNVPREVPIVAYLSRIHKKKGLEHLMESVAKVDRPCHLLIAGDGNSHYVSTLENLVLRLGLESKVQFIGFLQGENKDLLLQGADLFALTSYSENFGIAVLEALAAGTPALVTEGIALASEIKTKNLGFVAAPTVASIAQNLHIALESVENRVLDGRQIQQHISNNFQWPAIADQLIKLYQKFC